MRIPASCLTVAAFLIGLMFCSPAEALNLAINKPVVAHRLAPGATHRGSLELSNTGDKPTLITLYLEDWQYQDTGDGAKEFLPAGTTPRSASAWFSFSPARIEIPPGETIVVDYTIRVPSDQPLDGGYYTMLFYEATLLQVPDPTREGVMINYAARLTTIFLIEVAGTVRWDAAITGVNVQPPTVSTPMQLTGQFTNRSNIVARCEEGSFHVQSPDGLVVARGELPARYAWPGQQVAVRAEWAGAIPPGDLSLVLTYDCGDEYFIAEDVPISVR